MNSNLHFRLSWISDWRRWPPPPSCPPPYRPAEWLLVEGEERWHLGMVVAVNQGLQLSDWQRTVQKERKMSRAPQPGCTSVSIARSTTPPLTPWGLTRSGTAGTWDTRAPIVTRSLETRAKFEDMRWLTPEKNPTSARTVQQNSSKRFVELQSPKLSIPHYLEVIIFSGNSHTSASCVLEPTIWIITTCLQASLRDHVEKKHPSETPSTYASAPQPSSAPTTSVTTLNCKYCQRQFTDATALAEHEENELKEFEFLHQTMEQVELGGMSDIGLQEYLPPNQKEYMPHLLLPPPIQPCIADLQVKTENMSPLYTGNNNVLTKQGKEQVEEEEVISQFFEELEGQYPHLRGELGRDLELGRMLNSDTDSSSSLSELGKVLSDTDSSSLCSSSPRHSATPVDTIPASSLTSQPRYQAPVSTDAVPVIHITPLPNQVNPTTDTTTSNLTYQDDLNNFCEGILSQLGTSAWAEELNLGPDLGELTTVTSSSHQEVVYRTITIPTQAPIQQQQQQSSLSTYSPQSRLVQQAPLSNFPVPSACPWMTDKANLPSGWRTRMVDVLVGSRKIKRAEFLSPNGQVTLATYRAWTILVSSAGENCHQAQYSLYFLFSTSPHARLLWTTWSGQQRIPTKISSAWNAVSAPRPSSSGSLEDLGCQTVGWLERSCRATGRCASSTSLLEASPSLVGRLPSTTWPLTGSTATRPWRWWGSGSVRKGVEGRANLSWETPRCRLDGRYGQALEGERLSDAHEVCFIRAERLCWKPLRRRGRLKATLIWWKPAWEGRESVEKSGSVMTTGCWGTRACQAAGRSGWWTARTGTLSHSCKRPRGSSWRAEGRGWHIASKIQGSLARRMLSWWGTASTSSARWLRPGKTTTPACLLVGGSRGTKARLKTSESTASSWVPACESSEVVEQWRTIWRNRELLRSKSQNWKLVPQLGRRPLFPQQQVLLQVDWQQTLLLDQAQSKVQENRHEWQCLVQLNQSRRLPQELCRFRIRPHRVKAWVVQQICLWVPVRVCLIVQSQAQSGGARSCRQARTHRCGRAPPWPPPTLNPSCPAGLSSWRQSRRL